MTIRSQLNAMLGDVQITGPLFGVEVEVETQRQIPEFFNFPGGHVYWTVTADNSLRVPQGGSAVEYVMVKPLRLEPTQKRVDDLYRYLAQFQPLDSYRTSVHVHVNYNAVTGKQFLNALILSVIFDEMFVALMRPHRVGNNFCLRIKDAEGWLEGATKALTSPGFNFHKFHGIGRYSSVNLESLAKFGTIEYRSMEFDAHNVDKLKRWLTTLAELRTAATETFKDPTEISQALRQDPAAFLRTALPTTGEYYINNLSNYRLCMRRGYFLAKDLVDQVNTKEQHQDVDDRPIKIGGQDVVLTIEKKRKVVRA